MTERFAAGEGSKFFYEANSGETPPNDIFQVIDFDRVSFDTGVFVDEITTKINRQHPGLGTELNDRLEQAYKREETFFLLRHLRRTQGDEWLETLVQELVEEKGTEHFMLQGAHKRVEYANHLTQLRPSYGILTYGDVVDQQMKLAIAQLQGAPLLITDSPNKSEVIASWQMPDGRFTLPPEFGGTVASHITLEDDKLRAFKDLPENATGVWITSRDDANSKLAATGLRNVVAMPDTYASLAYLTGTFAPSTQDETL